MVRKIISVTNQDLSESLDGKTLLDHLLEPTRIYVQQILGLIKEVPIKAIAHITGGGLIENIPRVIPEDLAVQIDAKSWKLPPIFEWLREKGNVDAHEMYKTFNCGVGLVLCIDADNSDKTLSYLKNIGEDAWVIGQITADEKINGVQIS